MNITLHQLKMFAAVVSAKSVSGAAKKLHLSQPAVSMQLKQLEGHLGVDLIEVVGKKVHITGAGEEVIEAWRQVDSILQNMVLALQHKSDSFKGQLNVCGASTSQYFLPLLLGEFCKMHPQAELRLHVTTRQQILERLKSNEGDFVVMSRPPSSMATVSEIIFEDEMVVVAAKDHPLASQESLPLSLLSQEPFVIREEGSGTREIIMSYFHRVGISPRIVMQLGSVEAIKEVVAAGFGISILPTVALKQSDLQRFAVLPFEEFPLKHVWYAVYPKGKRLSPLVKECLAFMRQRSASEGALPSQSLFLTPYLDGHRAPGASGC